MSSNSNGMYAKGCRFDNPHRKMRYKPLGAMTAQTTGLVSLAQYQPPIFDQGMTNSCEGHRAAMALAVSFNASGNPLEHTLSPDAIYRDARCQERTVDRFGGLSTLEDTGCATSDVLTILQTCGGRPMGQLATDGRYSDVSPETVDREPTLNELISERQLIITGEYAISLANLSTAMAKIQAALMSGWCIGLDIYADSAFDRWGQYWTRATDPLTTCNTSDPNGGGHAIALTECMQNTDGSYVLSGPNSWGGWGAPSLDPAGPRSGMWQATPDWLRAACDNVIVFQGKRVST